MCATLTISKLDLINARANCSHSTSGKGAKEKNRVYESVLLKADMVMQCANKCAYAWGPARPTLVC
jgi:hypothetical protein